MMAPDNIPPSYTWDQLATKLGLPTRLPSKQRQRAPLKRTVLSNESINSLLHTPCKDGERTAHLTTLIGKLLAAKHGPDEALALCHQWNRQNHEPLDDDKIDSTFASILAIDQRNHPERYQAQLPLSPLLPLAKGQIDHYISTDPPPRLWLVNDTIVLGKAGAIVAPGGSSKSQWLLQLAVGVATGIPVANHWQISVPGNVLVFCAEDDDDEVHRRLKRIIDHLKTAGSNPVALGIANRLRVFSTIGQETLMTKRSVNGEVTTTAIVEQIALMADEFKDVRLIVLDPASRFRGGEENSNEDATRFVEALETLAQRTGASVLIAHHTGKASYDRSIDPSQGASRGASALTDGLRWQMNLSPLSDKQLQSNGIAKGAAASGYVAATVTKTNYTAYPGPVILERLPNGYLQAISAQSSQQRRDQQARLQILNILASQPKPISARTLEDQFGGLHKTLKMPAHEVREHVKASIHQGWLTGGERKKLGVTATGHAMLQAHLQATDGASQREAESPRKKT